MSTITRHPAVLTTATDDRHRSLSTFTEAFRSDPAARWLFPDDGSYAKAFNDFATAFTAPAFANKTAFHTPSFTGACAWFAPGIQAAEEAIVAAIEKHVPASRLDEAFGIFDQMDAFHPGQPHWYLPLIGVHPASQGQGLGTQLLRHILCECDRTGHDAYLESSNADNLTLYERLGFQLIGEIQAGSSPTLYPMLRKPQ